MKKTKSKMYIEALHMSQISAELKQYNFQVGWRGIKRDHQDQKMEEAFCSLQELNQSQQQPQQAIRVQFVVLNFDNII